MALLTRWTEGATVRPGEHIQSQIMTVLRTRRAALSAYDLLAALRPAYPRIAPPTVYRALTRLMERGEIHRLESLNAFIACRCTGGHDAAVMSICEDCGRIEESVAPDLFAALSALAGQSGFQSTRHVVELHGRCASCHTTTSAP